MALAGELYAVENYQQLKAQAEKSYQEGSYALSYQVYLKVDKANLSQEEQRWVEFRLADTLWRAQSATQTADSTQYDKAQKQLEKLISEVSQEDARDIVWITHFGSV